MHEYKPIIRNKVYASVLVLIIVSMVSFVIVPNYLKIRKLNVQNENLIQLRNLQQKLKPLYEQVSLKADFEKFPNLPALKKGFLDRSKIKNSSQIFKDLAEKNGLNCLESRPDVNTLLGDSKKMMISLVLKGKLARFQNFLFDLTDLEYLDSLEEIQFISEKIGKKYMLKIWIAIQ